MLKKLFVSISKDYQPQKWNIDLDDPKGRYLYLGHPFDTKITYSMNFGGGQLILATNASRELTSLELLVPRAFWKQTLPQLQEPQPAIQGTLVLPKLNIRLNEFDDITPVVYSDDPLSFVNIIIDGSSTPGPLWARICDRCCINISDNHLIGFRIDVTGSLQDLRAGHFRSRVLDWGLG